MSKSKEIFKYKLNNRLFFSCHFFYSPSRKYKEIPLMGEYYAHVLLDGISTTLVEEDTYSKSGKIFLELMNNNDEQFCKFLYNVSLDVIVLADKFQEIYKKDVKNNSVSDLSVFYSEYIRVFISAIAIGYTLDYVFDQYFKNNNIDPTTIKHIGDSFQTREKFDLIKVFSETDLNKKEEMLLEHSYKYAWLLNDYTGEHLPGVEYFRNREKELANTKITLSDSKLSMPKNVLEWASLLIFIRDERKRLNLIGLGLLDRYLRKECKERNINYKYATMCSVEEFEEYKLTGIPEYSERYLKLTVSGPKDIPREEWQKVAHEVLDNNSETLVGQVASKGIVRGTARVIFDKKDFLRVNDGDIIVASMTRPEFAPILGKAGGIVTDEGGITCHAAIVSRELKIPCIIGTKIATQILKDGDIVEVNANTGVVTIIK